MPKITFITHSGEHRAVDAALGTSVMHAAVDNDVPGMVGECGGSAMCATCHCFVDAQAFPALPPVDENEDAMLEGTASERTAESRLGCQLIITEDLEGLIVQLPDNQI
ncbi:MAG: 2Fe-2S iron-sulfur cluster-binding protein [Rhizobiaceae bacterium]|nr:2Fe-2S iron-sulfur cluster-binding protein [Rhizobiaceae bacterium]